MLTRQRADEVLALWGDPTARVLLDAITLFSPEELFELLRVLGLQLAE